MGSDVTDVYKLDAIRCKPHIVLLGAGASCAAIPNGDRHGRKIPVMKGFLREFDLEYLLDGVELNTKSDNIEDIYSELALRPEYASTLHAIENAIVDVMSCFHIP